jgi:hypothetical protein
MFNSMASNICSGVAAVFFGPDTQFEKLPTGILWELLKMLGWIFKNRLPRQHFHQERAGIINFVVI